MRLLDFFNRKLTGSLFIDSGSAYSRNKERSAFDNIATDYILSRSLYSSAPAEDSGYLSYALGNYCTKLYIDTFCWFIGIPDITAESDVFSKAVQAFLLKNKSLLFNIYKQTMIDGKHFVWARIENTATGKAELHIKQIPRELVIENECIQNLDGGYNCFVFEQTKKWGRQGQEKKAVIRITLEAGKETITIEGDLPPEYSAKRNVTKNAFPFVPVFCLYNNKQTFLKDGIPEIAPAVPFIRRYDATLRKLGQHIDNILEPRLQIKVKNVDQFIKYSFGLTDDRVANIASGKEAFDPSSLKAAIIDGDDSSGGVQFITQNNNVEGTTAMLKLLHWIIVEMTMPEYLYGTAMNSTNASVSEQSPVWAKKVEGRQGEYNEFYYWLSDVFRIARTALAGRDEFASDGGAENIIVRWQELTAKDDVAMMNALSTFVGAMEKAMNMGLVSPKSAFNTLKNFMAIPADYETEKEAGEKWIKLKMNIEALQDRIRSGDIEAVEAVDALFKAE